MTMHILGIFAHPDDVELWAGGTVLLHLDRGDRVTMTLFYELDTIRVAELNAAWQSTAIDMRLKPTEPYTRMSPDATEDLLHDVPDVVLTHWNHDVHIEHRHAFEHAVLFCHNAKRYQKRTPTLLMASTYYGRGSDRLFDPPIIVDITATIDRKRAAIAHHASQHPERLLADVESQNRLLGARIGALYGEGFIEYPLFGLERSAARRSLADVIQATQQAR